MRGKNLFTQHALFANSNQKWFVLLFCLLAGNTLAAANDAAKQVEQNITKVDLEKVIEQVAKPTYPQTFEGAEQAFKDTNFLDALKILIKLESDYAGRVEYDYLLGRAALETGNFDAATAAFTRVLTVDPDFAAARFELARTFYSKGVSKLARGPFEQARSEFEIVSSMNPPAALSQAIEQYQANIDKYLEVRETEFRLFAEMTGGYDTNIGSTSSKETFSYFDYGTNSQQTYDLRNDNKTKESAYSQGQAGIGIDWPLFSNNFEVFGNLQAGERTYDKDSGYNHYWSEVQFGFRHYGENNKKALRFRFRQTNLTNSDERYHEQGETMFKWDIKNNETQAVSLWLLGGNSNYQAHGTHVFSVDYNRQGFEATILNDDKTTAFRILLMSGRDNPQECKNSTYCPSTYARDVSGFRASWSAKMFDSSLFYTSLYFENSDYDNDFFFQQRKDKRTELFIATKTTFGDSWYIKPEIQYILNDSSLDVYHYQRWVASLTFGWGI